MSSGEDFHSPSEEEIPLTFEEYMESLGYHRDSFVDSENHVSEWWENGDGVRLPKREVTSHHGAYKRNQGHPSAESQPLKTEFGDTEKLLTMIKGVLEREYGNAPLFDSKDKMMLRQFIKRHPKELIRAYAQWYFVDSSIEKKWRFSLSAFTSTKFINQFLAETGYANPEYKV
jgi:hypothetical protein